MITPDQRIDFARVGQLVEIGSELVQGIGIFLVARKGFGLVGEAFFFAFLVDPRDPVRQVIGHVEAFDVVLVQQVDGVRILLGKYRHQDVGAGNLTVTGGLNMEKCTLQYPLETECRLGVAILVSHQQRRVLIDENFELGPEQLNITAAGFDHRGGGIILGQHQQQMLYGNEFVALFISLVEGLVEGLLEFFVQHRYALMLW